MNDGKQKDILLAKGWPASRVRGCLRRRNRGELVRFLADRHRERFFEPMQCIAGAKGNEQGFGFSVMALCALLIETIQCYRDGLPTTDRRELDDLRKLKRIPLAYRIPTGLQVSGKVEFRRFFRQYRDSFPGVYPVAFYKKVRNGILHQGQTKGGWTLRAAGPIVCDPTNKIIYRNQFRSVS
jgi:hypothetical protein